MNSLAEYNLIWVSESSDTNAARGSLNIFDRIISVTKYHSQLMKIFLKYF